jgi:hypothetical protein
VLDDQALSTIAAGIVGVLLIAALIGVVVSILREIG